jgi:drug/metabolite transporter (DMT)-like permease
MTLFVFLSVIGAAFLHALWNALIKTGSRKLTAILILTLVQGVFGLAVGMTRAFPEPHVWWWLLGSGVFHSAYKLFLGYAYEHGDLSRVYPIARGAAPMLVLVASFLLLSDPIAGMEYLGVVILGLGILMMARGVFTSAESTKLVPLALGSAAMTAGYSIVDGLGARAAGDAVTYVAWLFVMDAVFFTPICIALNGRDVLRADAKTWGLNAVAAMASYAAYAIAVWAMTQAPIALVTALRETSILFAVLIGWLIFGDKMDRQKAIAAGLIVLGVVLTRL